MGFMFHSENREEGRCPVLSLRFLGKVYETVWEEKIVSKIMPGKGGGLFMDIPPNVMLH